MNTTQIATTAHVTSKINALNTAWTDLPLNSAFTRYNDLANNQPRYRRCNDIVLVSGSVTITAASTLNLGDDTEHTIGTLPTGFRPNRDNHVQTICQGSTTCIWMLRIRSNGVVSASRYRNGSSRMSVSSNVWLSFSMSFSI